VTARVEPVIGEHGPQDIREQRDRGIAGLVLVPVVPCRYCRVGELVQRLVHAGLQRCGDVVAAWHVISRCSSIWNDSATVHDAA
jgi:hypothetical protein